MLALNIGLRSAARAMGLSEMRVRNWSSRQKWGIANLPICRIPASDARLAPSDTSAIEAMRNVVQHYGDRAKIGATIAGAKALEHLADSEAATLVKPANSIAADQWTKAVDRAAGWTAARQAPVQVAVQVNLPSAEEQAELRETDAKLDEIARLLRETRPKA